MKKLIKQSRRGLTFSFSGKKSNFDIGDYYKYVIEPKSKKVFIVPSNSTKDLKVSRKKVGDNHKSLIDLRSLAIRNNFNDADSIEIEIDEDVIIIKIIKNKKTSELILNQSMLNQIKDNTSKTALNSILKNLKEQGYVSSNNNLKSLKNGIKTTIKVLSLFSGVGMFDYPLHMDSDFEIIKAVELNKSACETYKFNIGDIIENKDIREFKINETEDVDLLYGGVPCRPFSNANRVNRLDNHKEIDLIDEYVRILKSNSNFKAFVIENVPQILTCNNGLYLNNLKKNLKEFAISHIVLNDYECGGHTNRKRAFIFGSKIGKVSLNFIKRTGKTVRDAIKKVTDKWFNFKDITFPSDLTKEKMSYVPQGGNWMDIPKDLWAKSYRVGKTHSNTFRRLDLNKPSIALANFRKSNIIHPTENRTISVAEAIAISGFNDYKILGSLSERQQAIANAVPFNLGLAVKEIIKNVFINYFNKLNI